jgi:hypothetical protein
MVWRARSPGALRKYTDSLQLSLAGKESRGTTHAVAIEDKFLPDLNEEQRNVFMASILRYENMH